MELFEVRFGLTYRFLVILLDDLYHCCGSGIRCLFDPGTGMDKKSISGYGMNLNSLFFDADPGSAMEKIRIRDLYTKF